MKVIIDVDEEKYEWIKKNNPNADTNSIVGAIANGKPYEDKWVPVSERLPDKDGVYLVTLEYVEDSEIVNEIDIARFTLHHELNEGFHKAYPVIAWKPLPEAYQEGD